MEIPDTIRLPRECKICRGSGAIKITTNGGYFVGRKFYHDPIAEGGLYKFDCKRCPVSIVGGQNDIPNQPE